MAIVSGAALAIFVKTPGFSPIKTRLAQGIGTERAIAFYRQCLADMTALGQRARVELGIAPIWAVAEREALAHPLWQAFPNLWQGDGDLGDRLHCIYATLRATYEVAILIGADAPHLPLTAIAEARDRVEREADFAIGPSADGGFYLLAGRRLIPADLWRNVPYSVPTTRAELQPQLARLGTCHELPTTFDVDTIAELQHLARRDRRYARFLPACDETTYLARV